MKECNNKKIKMWGNNIPGNNDKSKLNDMNIKYDEENRSLAKLKFLESLVISKYKDVEQIMDTFTYLYEIKSGYEKETYEDEPYLIPYLVDGSDKAVIIVPGGGFAYKSIDEDNHEGKSVAIELNRKGINVFVLHYRANPYEYPIPYLDLQRAIRYVKFNSDLYGIDRNKISLVGYSAGGNVIGTFINVIQGQKLFPLNYALDEIDLIDDYIDSCAMIYPVVSFRDNIPMLFCLFNADDVRDVVKREELLKKLDLYKFITSKDVKQLIIYGTSDLIVGMKEIEKYIDCCRSNNKNIVAIKLKHRSHGMKKKYYIKQYLDWLDKVFNKF